MKQLESEFLIGAADYNQIQNFNLPEIAFIGRSNVGKSSLLNTILLQNKVARVSSTPGKTQQINLFKVDKKWIFADLPGFGYAVVSKVEREKWKILNLGYLKNRESLKLVFQLVDARHDPMEIDMALIELLEHQCKKYVIVLTKCDKISSKAALERQEQLRDLVKNCSFCTDVILFSSITKQGREELLAIIKREVAGE